MRHRKIQKKNQRKKLKSVDPYNTQGIRDIKEKRNEYNNDPQIEQETSNATKNFAKLLEAGKTYGKVKEPRKRKQKDPTEFRPRPWEDDVHFIHRVNRETSQFIGEHKMKDKFGLLGEDPLESKSDKRKRLKREKSEAQSNFEDDSQEIVESILPKPKTKSYLELTEKEKVIIAGGKTSTKSKKQRNKFKKGQKVADESEETCIKVEKDKESRLEEESAKRSVKWNYKEVIDFNERADAPPEFSGKMKTRMDAFSAKAGRKRLLLDDLIEKNKSIVHENSQSTLNDCTVALHLRQQRDDIIKEYRKMKHMKIMRRNEKNQTAYNIDDNE